jgi:hypothetical protein
VADAVENVKEKGERGWKIKLKSEELRQKKRLQMEKDETNNNKRKKNKDTKNVKKKIRLRSDVNNEKNNEENNRKELNCNESVHRDTATKVINKMHYIDCRIFRQITGTPNVFDIPFDVQITRMTLTSGRVRKYRQLLTEDTGVIPKNVPG